MKLIRNTLFVLSLLCPLFPMAQEMTASLARISTEGFQRSRVMETLEQLSDLYGPRLTGSHQYYEAAEWVKSTLESWGADRVYYESFCDNCMGWDLKSFNVEVTSPNYMKIMAYPYAWTLPSQGQKTCDLVWIEKYGDLTEVKKNWKGGLKDKMVLLGQVPKLKSLFEPLAHRFSGERLQAAVRSTLTSPQDPLGANANDRNFVEMEALFEAFVNKDREFFKFLAEEGAAGVLGTTALYPGIIHPSGTYNLRAGDDKFIPYFAIAAEQFSKLSRLCEEGIVPEVQFHLDAELYLEPKNNVNIIGELRGSDPKLRDEVIMIGAHFDSWHAASGVTDNGAGSVVMMEVMRIIKASGLRPRRTIRLALWGGEEQGYLGSSAYAANHFGKAGGAVNRDEADKISVYLNMDNGAGKMRGIYLQGNESARPFFENMLEPYAYLDVNRLSIENTNFTDHEVFDFYHIPAFQIIQDPLNYNTVTHHTNLDALEYAPEEDLRISATVLAALVYQMAMMDSKMPRK